MSIATLDGKTFGSFDQLPRDEQRAIVARLAARQPDNLVAHRVGDFVFTYHSIDAMAADGRLWLFIASPDPATVSTPGAYGLSGTFVAGRADGTTDEVPFTQFESKLAEQNVLRRKLGLAPIPQPWTVTSESPAVEK
jgi:hypothetical protein